MAWQPVSMCAKDLSWSAAASIFRIVERPARFKA